MNFEVCSQDAAPKRRKEDYIDAVQESLERVRSSLDMDPLYRLARDIRRYDKVAIFGVLKAETVAMNLQSDLSMLSKISTTKLPFSERLSYLRDAGPDELIVISSFTGIYFQYGMPKHGEAKRRKRPKIYFITSDPNAKDDGAYDEVIWFDSLQDQASHPYQLQLVGSLIAQCYAHLLQEEQREA